MTAEKSQVLANLRADWQHRSTWGRAWIVLKHLILLGIILVCSALLLDTGTKDTRLLTLVILAVFVYSLAMRYVVTVPFWRRSTWTNWRGEVYCLGISVLLLVAAMTLSLASSLGNRLLGSHHPAVFYLALTGAFLGTTCLFVAIANSWYFYEGRKHAAIYKRSENSP